MRLEENGLLRRDEQLNALLGLLLVMARTPAGSWAACPDFGLRDLFEGQRQRVNLGRLAMERTNAALADLGIDDFRVSEVVREVLPNQETESYSFTLVRPGQEGEFTTTLTHL